MINSDRVTDLAICAFSININPRPKQSTTFAQKTSKGKPFVMAYTKKDIKEYVKTVAWHAKQDVQLRGLDPVQYPIVAHYHFYRRTRHRVDFDNLSKAVGDACSGIVYLDDQQIKRAVIGLGLDRKTPRLEVAFYPLDAVDIQIIPKENE